MPERRREERTLINSHIQVENDEFDEKMGVLVDISPRGLRIRGEEPVEINEDIKLRLCLPEKILGKRTIRPTAVCVWSKPDSESGQWISGFEFYRVSQQDSSLIIGLILETKGQFDRSDSRSD
jgi:c-di-GMP-binding flagellar brake protein YcgR